MRDKKEKLAAFNFKKFRLPAMFTGKDTKSYVQNFYNANKEIHETLCRQWYKNVAFLKGYQWLDYYNNNHELTNPREVSWRVKAVFNKIFPLWLAQTSNLINFIPNITARPTTDQSNDVKNSDFARKMMQAFWRSENFQDIVDEWVKWKTSCTQAFIMPIWDGRGGKKIEEGVFTGDIKIEIPTPFEIILDYSETDTNNLTRFMRITVKNVEYLSQKYGIKVPPEDISVNDIPAVKMARIGINNERIEQVLKNHALVFEFFELPTEKYPDGLHYIGTSKKVLLEESLNYYKTTNTGVKEKILPIVVDKMYDIPGSIIGTDSVTQTINMQSLLNSLMSSVIENANRLSRPKILAPKDKILQGAMTEDPRSIVAEYDPDIEGSIEPLKPPEMPNYVLNLPPMIQQQMQEMFSIGDISLGRIPRRATTGPVVRFLGEKDDSRLKNPRKHTKKAIREVFRQILWLMQNNFNEERIVDTLGDDGKIQEKFILGSNLRDIDISVETDEGLPGTSGERLELAMAMLEKKLSPEQVRMAFRIIRINSIEDLENIFKGITDKEEDDARMETFFISKGMPVSPVVGENHSAHRQIHQEALSQPEFSDENRDAMMQHMQQHNMIESMESQLGVNGARQKLNGGAEGMTPQEQILGAQTVPGTVPSGTEI